MYNTPFLHCHAVFKLLLPFLSPLCEEDTIHLLTEHMGGDEFAPWKMTPTGDPGMYYAD